MAFTWPHVQVFGFCRPRIQAALRALAKKVHPETWRDATPSRSLRLGHQDHSGTDRSRHFGDQRVYIRESCHERRTSPFCSAFCSEPRQHAMAREK